MIDVRAKESALFLRCHSDAIDLTVWFGSKRRHFPARHSRHEPASRNLRRTVINRDGNFRIVRDA
jgi:hypothetical protein